MCLLQVSLLTIVTPNNLAWHIPFNGYRGLGPKKRTSEEQNSFTFRGVRRQGFGHAPVVQLADCSVKRMPRFINS